MVEHNSWTYLGTSMDTSARCCQVNLADNWMKGNKLDIDVEVGDGCCHRLCAATWGLWPEWAPSVPVNCKHFAEGRLRAL